MAANLAMSFSDAGFRTVLVDADTRRGVLHEMFQLPMGPGLTEYLSGAESLTTVVRPTPHERLSILSRGEKQKKQSGAPDITRAPSTRRGASPAVRCSGVRHSATCRGH